MLRFVFTKGYPEALAAGGGSLWTASARLGEQPGGLGQLDRLGTNMLRVTAGQTLFGGDAALTSEARAMIM